MSRLSLLLVSLLLVQGVFATDYTLSGDKISTSTEGSTTFDCNGTTIYITNQSNKMLANWSNNTSLIKFSNGVQYTIEGIPTNETVTSVDFIGAPHETGDNVYLATFNGTTYTSNDSPVHLNDGTSSNPVTVTLSNLAITGGSFSFSFKENQTCAEIIVHTTESTVLSFPQSTYTFSLTDLTADDNMPEPNNTTGETVTYSSSNTSVAACFNGGKPRIKNIGETTITATAGGLTATYQLVVTAPQAKYDLSSNAFEIKSIGVLDKKEFELDGMTFTFGGVNETPVAVENSDLGYGVICNDFNGYTFYSNDHTARMGSYIVITTTKAGKIGVRGNFVNDKTKGWTRIYDDATKNPTEIQFTAGNNLQTDTLEANKTYYLTTWHGTEFTTFYLNAISFTPTESSSSLNGDVTDITSPLAANGDSFTFSVKKGQKITINGHFYKGIRNLRYSLKETNGATSELYLNFPAGDDPSTTYDGTQVVTAKADGNVTLTNIDTTRPFYLTSINRSNSDPELHFEHGNVVVVDPSTTNYRNRVTDAPAGASLTYAVSTSDGLTVNLDEATGMITSVSGTGQATITATSGAIGYYNSATASYTLYVRTISFQDTEVNLTLNADGTQSYTQSIQNVPEGAMVTYSYELLSGSDNVVKLSQEEGSNDADLLLLGPCSIKVIATCGTSTAYYKLTTSGFYFEETYPTILFDGTTKTYTQEVKGGTPSNVSWSIIAYTDGLDGVTIAADESNSTKGIVSNINKTGAILVQAEITDDSGTKTAQYVLTVAGTATDDAPLSWDFNSSKLSFYTGKETPADHAPESETGDNASNDVWQTTHEGVSYEPDGTTKNNSYLYALKNPIVGNNAFIIPATAGLQFVGPKKTFGVNNSDDQTIENKDEDGTVISRSYTVNRFVAFKAGSTLIIPRLKKGNYVRIWLKPYSGVASNDEPGASGSRFTVENLTDLTGKTIDGVFSTTGCAPQHSHHGQIAFRVAHDGDVKFNIADNGWSNIIRIEVSTQYKAEMQMSMISKDANGYESYTSVNKENNNQGLVIVKGTPKTFSFKNDPGHTYSQSARSPIYTIGQIEGGTVDFETSSTAWQSQNGVWYNDLNITIKGGYGNLQVTQDVYCDGYLLDRAIHYLAVGEIEKNPYPYTWDFTDYNMSKGSTITNLHNGQGYGQWSSAKLVNRQTVVPDNTLLTGYNVDYPQFAQGAELTSATSAIKETQGLGVAIKYYTDENNSENSGEGTLGFGGTSNTKMSLTQVGSSTNIITIPSVDAGMYVYVKSSAVPTVSSNAAEVTEMTRLNSDVKCYYVNTAGDVTLTFGAADIEKIGVTNIFKTGFGTATSESRDCAIDYSQTGVFTQDALTAYIGTSYTDGEDAGVLTITPINVAPANTGLLLYKESDVSGYTIPLFVPAVNIASEDTTNNMLTAHVTEGTVSGSDATTYRYVFTNRFKYTGSETEHTADTYGFYKVNQSGTLAANKAYLELSNTTNSAKGFKCVLVNIDDTPTGIDDIRQDTVTEDTTNESWFTLQGIKLNEKPSIQGIYIHNGKKVIVR